MKPSASDPNAGSNLHAVINVKDGALNYGTTDSNKIASEPEITSQQIREMLTSPQFIGARFCYGLSPGELMHDLGKKSLLPLVVCLPIIAVLQIQAIKTASAVAVILPILYTVSCVCGVGLLHISVSVLWNKTDRAVDYAVHLTEEQRRLVGELKAENDRFKKENDRFKKENDRLEKAVDGLKRVGEGLNRTLEAQKKMCAEQIAATQGLAQTGENIKSISEGLDKIGKEMTKNFQGKLDYLERMNEQRRKQLEESKNLLSRREGLNNQLEKIVTGFTGGSSGAGGGSRCEGKIGASTSLDAIREDSPDPEEENERAALRVQHAMRSKIAKVQVRKKKEAKALALAGGDASPTEQDHIENGAAATMQAAYRGRAQRREENDGKREE